jgi:hypothetical protein
VGGYVLRCFPLFLKQRFLLVGLPLHHAGMPAIRPPFVIGEQSR